MLWTWYLLGYSINPGLMGGCAIVREPIMQIECTYGAGAECTVDTLKTCKVPVYSRPLTGDSNFLKTGVSVASIVRDEGPPAAGPVTRYATASEITEAWLYHPRAIDLRPEDQIRDGSPVPVPKGSASHGK
jgi:hypothetical protein